MTTQEQKQFKISIFSSAFKFLLKPLIAAVKKEFKEHALEWLIEIVKDAFEKSDEEIKSEPIPTCPKGQEWNPVTKTCQDPIGK
jgi:hypothetical protein